MSATRHPEDDTLAALAAGVLRPGPRLVVTTHVAACPRCRNRLRAFESIGGALLDEATPAFAADELIRSVWARIEAPAQRVASRRPVAGWREPFPGAPATLRDCEIAPWRFIQPGLRIAMVTPSGDSEASAMLMRVKAGGVMPWHTHEGVEYMLVLSGSYTDANGRYVAGDYDEADGDVNHQPRADRDADCICLSAVEGRLKLTSFLGRIVQSVLRF